MAIVENDYAAYLKTSDGEIPLRDLDAQEKIDSLSEDIINNLGIWFYKKNVNPSDAYPLFDFSDNYNAGDLIFFNPLFYGGNKLSTGTKWRLFGFFNEGNQSSDYDVLAEGSELNVNKILEINKSYIKIRILFLISEPEGKKIEISCRFKKVTDDLMSMVIDLQNKYSKCITKNSFVTELYSVIRDYIEENDFIVIPQNLYLVENIDYGVLAKNIHRNIFIKDNNVLHEIALPTHTERFTETGHINIPFSFSKPYWTKIGFKDTFSSNMKFKDLFIHVSSKSIEKTCSILTIGDSICDSNLPRHIKWWLSKFGVTANMIGTRACEWSQYPGFEYGIYKDLDVHAKGEGRGGYRLLEYAEMALDKNKSPFHNYTNPFRNPETNTFDLSFYMNQNSFESLDWMVISLGTNDILYYTGFDCYTPNMGELLNNEGNQSLINAYNKMIESAKEYNPEIKICIVLPQIKNFYETGTASFDYKSLSWASKVINELENPEDNVFIVMPLISQGKMSIQNIDSYENIDENGNYSNIPNNIHFNGMGQLVHSLYVASLIVNI